MSGFSEFSDSKIQTSRKFETICMKQLLSYFFREFSFGPITNNNSLYVVVCRRNPLISRGPSIASLQTSPDETIIKS